MSTQRAAALLGVIVNLSACGSDADRSARVEHRVCARPEPCDIADEACVEAVLDVTACERGDETPPLPTIRHVSKDELREELAAMQGGGSSEPTLSDRLLQRLHLLPVRSTAREQSVELAVANVLAYFDSETKAITIVDGATTDEPLNDMYLLSHELTHYLQDRARPYDELAESFGRSVDAQISMRSLIEGEAVVTSIRVLSRLTGNRVSWSKGLATLERTLFDSISESEAPLNATALNLPYTVGANYVADVWNVYGRDHVDALFDRAPHSLVDWLAGYGDGGLGASHVEPLDCAPPVAVEDHELASLDDFGPGGVIALLAAASELDDTMTASRLRGGAVAIYQPKNGSSVGLNSGALVWRLRFASADAASQFATKLTWDEVGVRAFGREVVVAVGPDVTRDKLPSEVDSCPTFDELKNTVAHNQSQAASAAPSIHAGPLMPLPQQRDWLR